MWPRADISCVVAASKDFEDEKRIVCVCVCVFAYVLVYDCIHTLQPHLRVCIIVFVFFCYMNHCVTTYIHYMNVPVYMY
jgi:hypothetical protein